jgi:hypothetical protein
MPFRGKVPKKAFVFKRNEGEESFIHYSVQYKEPGIVTYGRFALINRTERFLEFHFFLLNKIGFCLLFRINRANSK